MMMSRREILDTFLRRRGQLGDSVARIRAAQALNGAYLSLWLSHPWRDHLLPFPVEVTTVANQRAYALPQYFGRVPPRTTYLRNLTTGRKVGFVEQSILEELRPDAGSSLETAGVPEYAYIGGPVGVRVQPAWSGPTLEVLSSSTSDTGVRVVIEGVRAVLDPGTLSLLREWGDVSVTLTGTSPVEVGLWSFVSNFTKAYPDGVTPPTPDTSSVGTVTLRTVSDSANLQSLLPEESAREFPSLVLYPKPVTAGEIIAIPTIRTPKRLRFDADECPRFWSNALMEEMNAIFMASNGDVQDAAQLPRPERTMLVMHDNSVAHNRPIRTRPFGG